MNLSVYDWGLLIVAVVGLRYCSVRTTRHMKGVADFLSANRSAGRYLLTIATWMGNVGTISFIALSQNYYKNGFPPIWWQFMGLMTGVVIILTGWVYYRFRETRALTMAQFLEMRYNRRFRILAGIMAYVSGVLNFGIFPIVTARFFMYFCGLPEFFRIPGIPLSLPTVVPIMIVDLGVALYIVMKGGQITVMVTDCLQGIFTASAFLVIIAYLLLKIKWPQIVAALSTAPEGASMLHPYHTSKVKDFNIWFYLIAVLNTFYTYMAFQGGQAYASSGKNPHEQRMGQILGVWRSIPTILVGILMPVAAFTIMKSGDFPIHAASASAVIERIADAQTRDQMTMPIVLATFLPIGIKGLLVTCMLFFSFTCHDTYLHSWGSIFVQDVVLPIRESLGKLPLSPKDHITWLRVSIFGVATFAVIFSMIYAQTMPILFFMVLTGAIFTSGAGAAIIGGLYWKRGTTQAAFASLIVGSVLGVSGLCADYIWNWPWLHTALQLEGEKFPINGQYLNLIAILTATTVYIVVSLLTGGMRKPVDMDKILHRGRYAAEAKGDTAAAKISKWREITGIRQEFSFTDKLLAYAMIIWNLGWFSLFLIVTVIHFTLGTSVEWWAGFWHFYLWMQFGIGVPAMILLSIGGIMDIRALFKALDAAKLDASDDGRVIDEARPVPAESRKPASGSVESKP